MDLTNVRMKEHCGLVSNDTGTFQFNFLISPLKNKAAVEKESYISVNHPVFGDACPVLAIVKEIKSYQEVAGSTLGDRVGKMLAVAEVVGYVNTKEETRLLRKLLTPPNPGTQVYMPYAEFIEDTFSRDAKGKPFKHALHMGKTESYATTTKDKVKALNFYLDSEDLMNGHSLIAAVGGAGKTNIATVLVEELANKTTHPIVILDPYGEYSNVGVAGKNAENLPENGEPSSATYPFNFTVSILTTNPDQIGKTTKENATASAESPSATVKSLPEQIWKMNKDKAELEIKDALEKSIKANRVTIVNPAGLSPQDKQTLFEHCLTALMKSRFDKKVEPVFVVVEDAENLKRELLETVAHEGRKTGISLCLLSTNPTELGGKVLSHVGTQFLGKTTDKDNIKYLKNIVGGAAGVLPQLIVGEWIINRISAKQPTQVTIRKRYSFTEQQK